MTRLQPALIAVFAIGLLASLAGCEADLALENGTPRVTWIAVQPQGAGTAEITVWLQDVEGDAVDLAVTWRPEGGAAADEVGIAMAPGSYGLVGLQTDAGRFDANGQANRVLWDTSALAGRGALVLSPDDRPYDAREGQGAVAVTPDFELTEGLPEAVDVSVP